MAHNGSVQGIKEIPDEVKKIYKTVWEISQKTIINMAARRAPFIDQSQSLNIHLLDANLAKMSTMHFYAWKSGLKTGMYYLRTKPAVDAIKFTLNMEELLKATESNNTDNVLKCIGSKVEEENKENSTNSSQNVVPIVENIVLVQEDMPKEEETECHGCDKPKY
jgi:ribonucleotide reductase alpha subunit